MCSADTGGRADLAEVADTFGARMIEYNFEDMSAKYGPMNLHRFRLFSDFLAAADTPYEQVLMCDIRDVFFQLDPFQELAVSEGLGVALEPEHLTIGACAIHARWLSDECLTYQQERVLDSIANKSRSCAGTTIGTHEAVAAYCEIMQQEARRTVHAVSAEQARAFSGRITTFDGQQWWGWCNDQAMHNALLWSGRLEKRFPVTMYSAEKSPLATVGTMKTLRMNAEGELLAGCAVGNSNEEDEEGGHRDHQEHGRDGLDTRDEDEEADGDVDFGKRDGVRRSRLRSAPPTAPTRVDATFGASARLSIRSREHESPARPRLRADDE